MFFCAFLFWGISFSLSSLLLLKVDPSSLRLTLISFWGECSFKMLIVVLGCNQWVFVVEGGEGISLDSNTSSKVVAFWFDGFLWRTGSVPYDPGVLFVLWAFLSERHLFGCLISMKMPFSDAKCGRKSCTAFSRLLKRLSKGWGIVHRSGLFCNWRMTSLQLLGILQASLSDCWLPVIWGEWLLSSLALLHSSLWSAFLADEALGKGDVKCPSLRWSAFVGEGTSGKGDVLLPGRYCKNSCISLTPNFRAWFWKKKKTLKKRWAKESDYLYIVSLVKSDAVYLLQAK